VASAPASLPEGLVVIGRHGGVEPQTRQDGSAVAGRYQLIVESTRGDFSRKHFIRFPSQDEDGEPAPFWRKLDKFSGGQGDLVAVRVSISKRVHNGKAYTDLNGLDITLLPQGAKVAAVA
jgi:hypothetical protein